MGDHFPAVAHKNGVSCAPSLGNDSHQTIRAPASLEQCIIFIYFHNYRCILSHSSSPNDEECLRLRNAMLRKEYHRVVGLVPAEAPEPRAGRHRASETCQARPARRGATRATWGLGPRHVRVDQQRPANGEDLQVCRSRIKTVFGREGEATEQWLLGGQAHGVLASSCRSHEHQGRGWQPHLLHHKPQQVRPTVHSCSGSGQRRESACSIFPTIRFAPRQAGTNHPSKKQSVEGHIGSPLLAHHAYADSCFCRGCRAPEPCLGRPRAQALGLAIFVQAHCCQQRFAELHRCAGET